MTTGHQPTEELLDRHGATWTLEPDLALDRIDTGLSAREQYRLQTVNPDTVARYAQTMTDQGGWGDFPPAIVRRSGPGGRRLALVGGMHRTTAADHANITHGPAYLIRCPPKVALLIALDDNAKHGQPLGNSERGALGARLVLDHRIPQVEAAATVGVSQSTVSRALLAERSRRRADELDVPVVGLSPYVVEELGRLDDDRLFARCAQAVVASTASATAQRDLIRRARDTPTLERALVLVDEWEDLGQVRHKGGRGVRVPDADRLTRLCWDLADLDADAIAQAAVGGDVSAWRERLKTAARRLMAIDHAIARQGRGAA